MIQTVYDFSHGGLTLLDMQVLVMDMDSLDLETRLLKGTRSWASLL